WWLDETNRGASVVPAFGAAYLRAVAGDRPCAAEPYLMSRGSPHGTDSFPHHERLTRTLLALTYGGVAAHSLGWPGHRESTRHVFALADLLGVSYRGRRGGDGTVALDVGFWKERLGVARLTWTEHALVGDERLARLVPTRSVSFRGPRVPVSEPADGSAVAW